MSPLDCIGPIWGIDDVITRGRGLMTSSSRDISVALAYGNLTTKFEVNIFSSSRDITIQYLHWIALGPIWGDFGVKIGGPQGPYPVFHYQRDRGIPRPIRNVHYQLGLFATF